MQSLLTHHKLIEARNKYGIFNHLANDEVIGYYYLQQGHPWEESVVDFNLGLIEKSVIDAGAHIGTHSIPYAQKAETVYAFEAQTVMYQLLLANIIGNHCTNIIPYRRALGSKKGIAHITGIVPDSESKGLPLTYEGEKKVNYGGLQLGQGGEAVPIFDLDSLALSDIRFFKADVEGSEPLVFHGARQTITKNQPIIMYEDTVPKWGNAAKRITPEMIQDLNLNAEEISFSIADYCVKHLGYSPPYTRDNENFYLFPPTHNIALRQLSVSKITAYQEQAEVSATPDGGWQLRLGARGPFPLFALRENTVRCIFIDAGEQYYDAEVKGGLLQWSNGTVWNLH